MSIEAMMMLVVLCFGLLVVSLWLFTCIFTAKGKTAVVLETFGKPHEEAAMPGLHFKAPWPFTQIAARVNLQLQEIGDNIGIKTRDSAFLTLPVKVQFRASDNPVGAVKAHYELEDPKQQISSYILNNVRQTAAGLSMDDLYENRDALEKTVKSSLTEQFAKYGYIIENVLVDQPQPSDEVRAAFNRVIASKRLLDAANNEAEAAKVKLVGVAKAESESKELQGQGIAKMRKEIAHGVKEAMDMITATGLTAQEAVAFLTDTNRLDTISSAAAHGNMVIVDTRSDSKSLAETIAAVKVVANSGSVTSSTPSDSREQK